MKAAVLAEYGKPPTYQDFADPVLQTAEVLVHVRAAGLHPLAKALASGTHYASGSDLPIVAGVDGIGTLDSGRRVYFVFVRKPWGTMAELAPAKRSMCVAVPDAVDDVTAAALVNPGQSAWMSLSHRAQLKAGESVMILGATGVAGQLAIQVARHLGARRVVGAGRNLKALEGADVDATICLADPEQIVREAFAAEAARGIDVVVDYLWGSPAEWLMAALARQFDRSVTRATRWVEVGTQAGQTIALPGSILRSVDLRVMGSGFGASPLEQILAAIPELFRLVVAGRLKIAALARPLSKVEEAWERTEKGGRIVLTI